MQWLVFVLFVLGPAMGADRIRSVGQLNRAIKLEAIHDMDAALRAGRQATEIDPTHAKAHRFVAQLYYKQKKYGDAAVAFEAAREAETDDEEVAELSYLLGNAHTAKGEEAAALTERKSLTRQAVAAYTVAVTKGPGHYKAYHRRATAHDWLDDPDAADADLRQCIRVNPQYAPCFVSLANLYADFGFVAEAVAVVEAGVAANGKDAVMWTGAGRTFLDLGRPAEAIRHFRKALAIDPELVDALFGVGMAYAETRDRENAVRSLTDFLAKADADVPESIKRHAQNTVARMQDAI